jgi:hypothetical protein
MLTRVIPFSHQKIKEVLTKESYAIDATIGNGHDTLFLCKNAKYVYGFDIQDQALLNTDTLLKSENISNYSLHHQSHSNMQNIVTNKVKVITFNLGYLPGTDKSITTLPMSTITAIKNGLLLLEKNGIISITIYTGHKGGIEESNQILDYTKTLNSKDFSVLKYQFTNKKNAPYIIFIEKH